MGTAEVCGDLGKGAVEACLDHLGVNPGAPRGSEGGGGWGCRCCREEGRPPILPLLDGMRSSDAEH